MEEIRNAGALEKEIMDDARKRAEKLLRGREKALSELRESWAQRTKTSLKEMEADHAADLAALKLRHEAALPLEKKRAFLAFAEARLRESVHRFFSQLDVKRRDDLLSHDLVLTRPIVGSVNVSLRAAGLTDDEAVGLVKRSLPDVRVAAPSGEPTTPRPAAKAEAPADEVSLELTDAESGIIVMVSTRRIEAELLLRHREKLVSALLKGNITP
ncbi:MAG TPA: hypothetical protein VMW87_16660 [Spirochaetia bacterium]|nr:hypothetical protein [Spirochaetia bacterium]